MQLHEVDEIKEMFLVSEVNEALADGWRIVAVTTSAETGSGERAPVACYVLGRKKAKHGLKISAAAAAKANERLSR